MHCGLVQVLEDVHDHILFTAYNYASSTVPGLVRHFEGYASFLRDRYRGTPQRLLEIGCNDGVLLKRLPRDWKLVGVDPSDVAARAKDPSYELVQAPFSGVLAADLENTGKFDIVTGSNCLAHISDLLDIFRGVRTLLRVGGEFFLEVHDLAVTTETGQWDTIYHEHKAEWSEESLASCLSPLGFEPSFLARLPLHGGLLRAGFRKVPMGKPRHVPRVPRLYEKLRRAYDERRKTPTYRRMEHALAEGQPLSAYGAAGRANVWLNQLPEVRFSYIVDDSPLRSGKWIPCIGTPVVSAQHFVDHPTALCVITAWNFARDIQARYPGFQGRWLQSVDPAWDG
jgi:SAM-dependent methyltransferase